MNLYIWICLCINNYILICLWFPITTSNKHVNDKNIACCIDGNIINNVNDNNCKLCEYSAVGFVMDLHLTQWLDGGLCKEEKALTKAVGLDHQTRRLYDTRSRTRSLEIFCQQKPLDSITNLEIELTLTLMGPHSEL